MVNRWELDLVYPARNGQEIEISFVSQWLSLFEKRALNNILISRENARNGILIKDYNRSRVFEKSRLLPVKTVTQRKQCIGLM